VVAGSRIGCDIHCSKEQRDHRQAGSPTGPTPDEINLTGKVILEYPEVN